MIDHASAVAYAHAWRLNAGPEDLYDWYRDDLYAWVRDWARTTWSKSRRNGPRLDSVDLSAILGREVGYTLDGAVNIVPSVRLLKAAMGSEWPPDRFRRGAK